jgi:Nuclease-related domain
MPAEQDDPTGADRQEWTDLAANVPGMGVFHEATLRRHRDGPAAGRSWQVGGEGEYSAGQMLGRFTTASGWERLLRRSPRWRVLHSVPLRDARGAVRGDIDHVLIGPPGVVIINTKHHPPRHRHGRWGPRCRQRPSHCYVAKARQEANRARTQLTAATPSNVC